MAKQTRRDYLLAVSAVGVTGVAGCSSGGEDDPPPDEDAPDDTPTSTPTQTTSDGETTAPGDSETPTSSPTEITGTYRTLGADMARTSALAAENGSTPKPSIQWRYSTQPYPSEPLVVNGRVYTVSTRGETLHAIDGTTGKKLWSKSVGRSPKDGPTVVDGAVYVASRKKVRSYNAESGAERWTRSIDGVYSLGNPAVANGSIYVSDGSKLVALSADSGKKQWSVSGEGSRSPTVLDGVVYGWNTGTTDNRRMVALDAATGDPIWTADDAYGAGLEGRVPVAVRNGRLFVPGRNTQLTALDAGTGERLWQKDVEPNDGTVRGPAAVDGGVLASTIGPKGNRGRVVAFDAETGERQWTAKLGAGVSGGNVAGGTYYGGLSTQTGGGVFALNVETGKKKWSLSRSQVAGVTPVDGGLLVAEFKKGISLLQ